MATVTITLNDGTMIGSVEVSEPNRIEKESDEYLGVDLQERIAAVAWETVARRAVFTVNRGKQYTAQECADWWA